MWLRAIVLPHAAIATRCNGSNPHPEVRRRSRSLEGRGLRIWGRVRDWMLRGFALRSKHLSMRAEGVVVPPVERAEYAAHPPLPCRASPPEVGRSARGALTTQQHAIEKDRSARNAVAPHQRSRCPVSQPPANLPTRGGDARQGRGGELAPALNLYRSTAG